MGDGYLEPHSVRYCKPCEKLRYGDCRPFACRAKGVNEAPAKDDRK